MILKKIYQISLPLDRIWTVLWIYLSKFLRPSSIQISLKRTHNTIYIQQRKKLI